VVLREVCRDSWKYIRASAEMEFWRDSWTYRASGSEGIVERHLYEQLGEWLKRKCGATVGCTERVAERELWSDRWMYRMASE